MTMTKLKSKLLSILLIISILIAPLVSIDTKAANDYYLYKGNVLVNSFIYDGPSYQCNRIGSVNSGKEIKVYQDVVNWAEGETFRVVKYNGIWGYVPYYNVVQIEQDTTKKVSASNVNTYGFISLEGNLRKGSYEELLNSYLLLPNYIRSMFQIEGFTLRMTENDVQYEAYGPQGYGGTLRAVFDYEVKKLWTNDENARYIVHEMGHYVNDRLGMFSQRPENKKIYETECLKTSLYSKQNANEYYAECFDMYFRCPSLLKGLSPLSYDMIERSLNEFYNIASGILPKELL